MGLGVEMAATMVLPILLGIYLDDTFGFEPWGVLLGVFFGLIGLMSRLYKLILMLKRESPPTKKLK